MIIKSLCILCTISQTTQTVFVRVEAFCSQHWATPRWCGAVIEECHNSNRYSQSLLTSALQMFGFYNSYTNAWSRSTSADCPKFGSSPVQVWSKSSPSLIQVCAVIKITQRLYQINSLLQCLSIFKCGSRCWTKLERNLHFECSLIIEH